MAQVLYCKSCAAAYEVEGMIPSWCPICSGTLGWTTTPPSERQPVRFSVNDKKFLHGVKIDPEQD